MSILIAYKKDDVIYMGTDTREIVNDDKRNDLCECNYKIQRLENGLIVGATAERLTRQSIFAYPEVFTLDKKGELTRKHVVKEIIPKLIEVLEREELIVHAENKLPYMNAGVLLAHNGDLYEICSNFSVYKYETFQALGTTSPYGQFVLNNVKETDDVNEQIIKALDVIAKNSQLVGKPYLLIDTKQKEYKLVGDN